MTGRERHRENLVARALVRILDGTGTPWGFGLLVAHGMVATCAHVVAFSVGEEPDMTLPPMRVELDFPFVAPGVTLTAKVVAWRPLNARTLDDFAGLVLDGDAPEGVVPLPMTRGGNVSDHDFLVYGYRHSEDRSAWHPDDKPVWVPGRITGRVEGGALQLGIGELTGGLRIQTGFSGTPVLDTQTRQIVGLVSGGLPGRSAWLAYAISGESVYDAWPELRTLFGQAKPFRGIAPFTEADCEIFFGRDELASYAARQISHSEHVIVSGASGAGKTSLLSAAIIPELRRAGSAVLVVRPSDRGSLWAVLAAAVVSRAPVSRDASLTQAEQRLAAAFTADAIKGRVRRLCDELGSDRVVLVVDQFEELLLADRASCEEFTAELWRLPSERHPEGRPRVRVVVVAREDQLDRVRGFLPDSGSSAAEIRVDALDESQIRAAIEGPVARSGFARFEEWLVDRIIDDMRVQPYSLPALQVTLTELWEHDADTGLLTHATYQEINRPPGPLATSLEGKWQEMGQDEKREALRLFLHLVVPVNSGGYSRRVMPQDECSSGEWRVAGVLATQRLLVLRASPTGATAELIHDALIEHWPLLRKHLDHHRAFLQWRDDLRRQIRNWQHDNHKPAHLISGSQLQLALTVLVGMAEQVTERERNFITSSRRRRTVRQRRLAATAAAVIAIVMVVATVIANLRAQAGSEAVLATARQVASLADADLGTNLDTAQLLAVGAYQLHDDPQTEAALFRAATADPQLVRYYQAGGQVTSLGTSADGQVVAAGTAKGRLAWFNPSIKAYYAVQTKLGSIRRVAVDATGSLVMAADMRRTILWEPNSDQVTSLPYSGNSIVAISISPSGVFAAIVQKVIGPHSDAMRIIVRDVHTGTQVQSRLTGFGNQITFPSPRVIAISGCGIWTSFKLPDLTKSASGGKVVCPATNAIMGSSSNNRFSAYATYGSVTAWLSADTSRIYSANGMAPAGAASSVAVSDNGERAAIVEGGRIFVAPLGKYSLMGEGQRVRGLSSNSDTNAVDFMGSSTRLVAAVGSSVALWDLSRSSRIGSDTGVSVPYAGGLAGLPTDLSISPDGRTLVFAGQDSGNAVYRIGKSLHKQAVWKNPAGGLLAFWNDGTPVFMRWTLGRGRVVIANSTGKTLRQARANIGGKSYIMAARTVHNGTEAVFVDQAANIWVLDLVTGRESRFNAAPGDLAISDEDVAVSEDGRFAIVSDRGHGRVIAVNLVTGSTRVVGSGRADGVLYADGKVFIQRDSGPLQVWDESGSHLVRSLPGSGGDASAMTVTRDGTRIATLSEKGVVSILSARTGYVIGTFTLPPAGGGGYDPWLATSMQFTPDGDTLFAATSGGEVTRWTVATSALAMIACATAGRAMTAAEWRSLVNENPPKRLPCQGLTSDFPQNPAIQSMR